MTSLKILTLALITFFSQAGFSETWSHQEFKKEGYTVKLSYTTKILPATYGSNGGTVANEVYIDVYSSQAASAQSAEVYDVSGAKLSHVKLKEDSPFHFWAAQSHSQSYADFLYVNQTYSIKVLVDGRELRFRFKIQ